MKKGSKIDTIRFKDSIPVGKSLDPKSFLQSGMRVNNIPVEVSFYDDTFFRIQFKGETKALKYSELVPWAVVSNVIFEDDV